MVNCIYVTASRRDFRYTRSCVASIRDFYPDVPIRLLCGGPLQRGLADELRRYWSVGVADFPEGDYGWGFVKLEPLFRPPGERFLVLDSDTVMSGPVLELAAGHDEDFIVDNEEYTPDRAKEIYFDWMKSGESGMHIQAPAFLFNTGQWFGKSGVLSRQDFDGLIEWGFPPILSVPAIFKNGEQGVLNFVLNELCRRQKIRVARVPLMHWPGRGMGGVTAEGIAERSCPTFVVHWAGMKAVRQQTLVGSDVLAYFERKYYERLPAGKARRTMNACRHALTQWQYALQVRARVAYRKYTTRLLKGMRRLHLSAK